MSRLVERVRDHLEAGDLTFPRLSTPSHVVRRSQNATLSPWWRAMPRMQELKIQGSEIVTGPRARRCAQSPRSIDDVVPLHARREPGDQAFAMVRERLARVLNGWLGEEGFSPAELLPGEDLVHAAPRRSPR